MPELYKIKDLLLCVYVVAKTLNLKFSFVIRQATSKNCTKVRAARAARLFFLIQPIRSLFSGVVVAVVLACLFLVVQTLKKCAADSWRLESCKTTRLRCDNSFSFIFEIHFPCTSLWFLLFVSENSKIFQGDVELQLTLADHVFKLKFALQSELSMSANSERS